jgi:hypothetical protein
MENMDFSWLEDEYEAEDELSEMEKIKIDPLSIIKLYDKEGNVIIFDLDDTLISTDILKNNKFVIIDGPPRYILDNIQKARKILCTSRKYTKVALELLIKELKKAGIDMHFFMAGDSKKHEVVKTRVEKYEQMVFIDDSARHVYGMMKNMKNITSIHFDDELLYTYKKKENNYAFFIQCNDYKNFRKLNNKFPIITENFDIIGKSIDEKYSNGFGFHGDSLELSFHKFLVKVKKHSKKHQASDNIFKIGFMGHIFKIDQAELLIPVDFKNEYIEGKIPKMIEMMEKENVLLAHIEDYIKKIRDRILEHCTSQKKMLKTINEYVKNATVKFTVEGCVEEIKLGIIFN